MNSRDNITNESKSNPEYSTEDNELAESKDEEDEILENYFDLGLISYEELESNIHESLNQNRPQIHDVPYLSEEEAKSALASYVSERFCYGKSPIKEMSFTNIECSNSYRYVLETFIESRKLSQVFEPFTGQPIQNNGSKPPKPWDILVKPKNMFHSHKLYLEVPNTAKVKKCKKCKGKGMIDCENCHSLGFKGRQGCWVCHRKGKINCNDCKGWAKLKWFIELEVNFENNVDDFIKKSQAVPDDLLRSCVMKSSFVEQGTRLLPINHHFDSDLNKASERLIGLHKTKFSNNRILMQKHEIKATPITLCTYKWKEKSYRYHVYGHENKVFAPDYPQQHFCSIL